MVLVIGMEPEREARKNIDRLLEAAGWKVQDHDKLDLGAGPGIAVREFTLDNGEADYLLFVDRKAVGVIEAKPEGTTLSGVAEQTQKYLNGIPKCIGQVKNPPFAYESTGVETYFRDMRDPDARSRSIFAFHRPETIREWLSDEETLRSRLKNLPPLRTEGLRDCQTEAITKLEKSFAESRPRALIQMATGSGKTFTSVSFIYRLIKHAHAKKILFLVDRSNLGRQTLREFQQYTTPDDGRKFTDLYNVQHLTSNSIDPVSKVCITTIQRLYSMLRGEAEFEEGNEERSGFDTGVTDERPKEVAYNPNIPIEEFDFIVVDECHRSIYHVWRQALLYFDAFIVGLTATPSKQTIGFFNKNLVMEYNHERAVADGVNVGYEVYRIKTEITEKGSKIEAGEYVDKRSKLTRQKRHEMLDEELVYDPNRLDRDVVAPDQIRTVIRTFRDRLFTEIFPGRKEVPKTLVFAKDDSHAEDIVNIIREEFAAGNEFCKKITYRTTGEKPEELLQSFRNSYYPRIAVTVDMISTGTDIKPLECLIFMRNVRSGVYFEQMKGRGTRTISPTDLKAVSSDAHHKTHFVIVDAVGVCERDKTDSRPLERKKSVAFKDLLYSIAVGKRDEDTITSLISRLTRLDREIGEKERKEIENVSGGVQLKTIINKLVDAIDADSQEARAKQMFKTDSPTREQLEKAKEALTDEACKPFDKPALRDTLVEVKTRSEQIIDEGSIDNLISAGFDDGAKEKARAVVTSFKEFIEANKDELTALQIIYSQPYAKRHLAFKDIKDLAEAIQKPPRNLTPERVWQAYEILERSKVKGAGAQKLLTNIISLVRFTEGQSDVLEPFPETVDSRFRKWVEEQEKLGRKFTAEQMEWLNMIKEHIGASLEISVEDLELTPFDQKGGPVRAYRVFGSELNWMLEELNEVLVA
ncbi:type I restriction modification system,restriction subunit [Methanocella arvoryzae MRE50]|uniref:Type I restriction modification system,restriction subunit n=2 Tax=Methanocella TaxID=570266 RepID=Q0W4T5_METAR|nr:type I restriction modification system,restriction subunit [Methanocella arvoryzae MRE50]